MSTHHHHDHDNAHHSHSQAHLLTRVRDFFFHSHSHGPVTDRVMENDARGIRALKASLLGLLLTAAIQMGIVACSGSIGLLSDAIHNVADALTAIPVWISFLLIRRGRDSRFTYGYGKTEDLAGLFVVLVIFSSAVVSLSESISRFVHPHPLHHPGWVAAAALIGFLGNEAVAMFRIRVGEEIGSVTLVADGKHSRVDGLASLLVLVGAFGQWEGFPLLDPVVGVVIGLLILSIVWSSGKSVFFRLVDGIDPGVAEHVRAVALDCPGVVSVGRLRVRWNGHRIDSEVEVEVDPSLSLNEVAKIEQSLEQSLQEHVPYSGEAFIRTIVPAP